MKSKWLVAICAFMLMGAISYGAEAWITATVTAVSPQGTEIVLQYTTPSSVGTKQCFLGSSSDTLWQNRALATVLTAVSMDSNITMYTDVGSTTYRVTQISLAP